MRARIQPSVLTGRVHAPASKSSMQRALAAALLCRKPTYIYNAGRSNDDRSAMQIIEDLGVSVEWRGDDLCIGRKRDGENKKEINCGESGLACRLFTPIVSLLPHPIKIIGEGSLLKRPMDLFEKLLPQLGVQVRSNKGMLPLEIKGPLLPRDITIDGSLSSQFLTGLLYAYAGAEARGVTIKVNNLASKPYIDLTLEVMRKFDLANIENRNYEEFIFREPLNKNPEYHYTVESDWSGAAFLLVAGAIAGPITVTGLDLSSTQADKAIVDAMMSANAGIAIEAKGIKIHPTDMSGFEFDATDCPDLFPPLTALAAYCNGITKIKGVVRLKHKESDRATALRDEFGKMGLRVEIDDDAMVIHGNKNLKGAIVQSHNDHRIAMALAVVALGSTGETTIENAESVDKSYPGFFEDLKKLGAAVSLSNSLKHHE